MIAALLRDPEGKQRLQRALDQLAEAGAAAAAAGRELTEGQGVLGRLLADEEYAGDILEDFAGLTKSLRSVAEKLARGEGSAGRVINDPQIIEDLESIVRGMNESKLVRWFMRNRREAGEKAEAEATPGAGS